MKRRREENARLLLKKNLFKQIFQFEKKYIKSD